MSLKISTLCDNYTIGKRGLIAEHGLSILIEAFGESYLIDTGQSFSVAHNALSMDINLKKINGIILSHGHFDHTGGLQEVLKITGRMKIYAHPKIWEKKYHVRDKNSPLFIGIPFREEQLQNYGATFKYSKLPVQLSEYIWISGEIPRNTEFETGDNDLRIKNDDGTFSLDKVLDDQSVFIKSPKQGLIIILGCAHSGIINTIRHAQKITGEEKIYAIVGGTHLGFCSEEQLNKTIIELESFDIKKIGVSHCTGNNAASFLANMLEEKFFYNSAGLITEL